MTPSRPQKKSLRALEKIVRTCLEKTPSRRFSDFIVLRERLTELYAAAAREALARPTKKAGATCKIAKPQLRFQTALGFPDRSEEFARAGASMHKLARFEEALISYEKALQLMNFDPVHKPVTQAQARVVIQMVRSALGVFLFEKANRCCELLLHCKVKDQTICETALLLRALATYASGRKRKAVHFCDQIIASNPRSLAAWYCKAGALLEMHEWENYRSALEKCLELQSVGPGWVMPGVRNKLSKGWWRKGWWWEEATELDLDYLEWLAKSRGFSIDRRRRSK
jgi:tetratricopeptide (TPR) repeat protein